jgi:uncharacterized protein YkwD
LNRCSKARIWILGMSALALLGAANARADVVAAVQVLREGGCGGVLPAAQPLHRNAQLDRTAEQWALGRTLSSATAGSGYGAAAGVFVRGPENSLLERLRRTQCHTLMDRGLREVGLYQRGEDRWLVLMGPGTGSAAVAGTVAAAHPAAAPAPVPATPPQSKSIAFSPALAAHALDLVNQARARGVRCGGRPYAPAPALSLSGTLDGVAFGHAADMAVHNYFEHQDLTGASPADRVRAVGFKEKLVGENIAYGPQTVEEVVQGWLDSPDHCENIMDPRFAQMGIAEAPGRVGRRGLYWVQLLVEPRA